MTDSGSYIILFDGVCNLCSAWVQFVIKRDPKNTFQFCALQSTTADRLLSACGLPCDDLSNTKLLNTPSSGLSTMILIANKKVYTKSSAALTVAKYLRWPWPLSYGLMAIPKPLRDVIYDFIGKRRYKWFGKRDRCWIPEDSLKKRFLDIGGH